MSNKDIFDNKDVQKILATSWCVGHMDRVIHDREYADGLFWKRIIFCVFFLLNIGLVIWLFWLFNWWIALLVGLVIFFIIIGLFILNIFSPSVLDIAYIETARRTIAEMNAQEKSDKAPMNTNDDQKTDE